MNKKLLYPLLGFNCLACAWILAVRCSSNLNAGAFCPTTGYESLMAYSVWKIQNHLSLYEWPQREPFALTLYNYLFYALYEHLLNCLRASGVGILLAGRMLTLLFACLFLLISPEVVLLVMLASSFAIAILVTLWIGGDQYRYSILIAARIVVSFSLNVAVAEWSKALLLNLRVWVLASVSLARQVRQ